MTKVRLPLRAMPRPRLRLAVALLAAAALLCVAGPACTRRWHERWRGALLRTLDGPQTHRRRLADDAAAAPSSGAPDRVRIYGLDSSLRAVVEGKSLASGDGGPGSGRRRRGLLASSPQRRPRRLADAPSAGARPPAPGVNLYGLDPGLLAAIKGNPANQSGGAGDPPAPAAAPGLGPGQVTAQSTPMSLGSSSLAPPNALLAPGAAAGAGAPAPAPPRAGAAAAAGAPAAGAAAALPAPALAPGAAAPAPAPALPALAAPPLSFYLPAGLREALGVLNTTAAVNASAFRPNGSIEYQPGNRRVCDSAAWRGASLGLLQEQPLAGLFPALGNQSAFRASGLAVHDGLLLTTFAECAARQARSGAPARSAARAHALHRPNAL